ncbi:hypothetical protein X777_04960, partial [Ooceraea biroi]
LLSSAVTPEVAAAEVDRATPAMEDTNTNPDTCSHQVSQIGWHKPDLLQQDSSMLSIDSAYHALSRSGLLWFLIGSVLIEKCL